MKSLFIEIQIMYTYVTFNFVMEPHQNELKNGKPTLV